jgi:hypothetical protein
MLKKYSLQQSMHIIPFTTANEVSLAEVLKNDPDALEPISQVSVEELNHPFQIGEWEGNRFVPQTNKIYDLESIRK